MRANIKASLDRYAADGVPTGDFLRAVLSNDLKGAIGRADEQNLADLFEIVDYVYNDMPMACQGSPEKVEAWLRAREERRASDDFIYPDHMGPDV